jgi:hypothetical protein
MTQEQHSTEQILSKEKDNTMLNVYDDHPRRTPVPLVSQQTLTNNNTKDKSLMIQDETQTSIPNLEMTHDSKYLNRGLQSFESKEMLDQ